MYKILAYKSKCSLYCLLSLVNHIITYINDSTLFLLNILHVLIELTNIFYYYTVYTSKCHIKPHKTNTPYYLNNFSANCLQLQLFTADITGDKVVNLYPCYRLATFTQTDNILCVYVHTPSKRELQVSHLCVPLLTILILMFL